MCGQCSVWVACQNGRWCFPVEDCVAPLSLPLSLRRDVQSPFGDHSHSLPQVATYNFPCFLFSTYVSVRLTFLKPRATLPLTFRVSSQHRPVLISVIHLPLKPCATSHISSHYTPSRTQSSCFRPDYRRQSSAISIYLSSWSESL